MEVVTNFIRFLPLKEQLWRPRLIVGNNRSNILIQPIAMIVMGSVFTITRMLSTFIEKDMNWINYWSNFQTTKICHFLSRIRHIDTVFLEPAVLETTMNWTIQVANLGCIYKAAEDQ